MRVCRCRFSCFLLLRNIHLNHPSRRGITCIWSITGNTAHCSLYLHILKHANTHLLGGELHLFVVFLLTRFGLLKVMWLDLLDLTGEFVKYSGAADVEVDIEDLSITNSTPIHPFSSVYPINSSFIQLFFFLVKIRCFRFHSERFTSSRCTLCKETLVVLRA